MIGRFWIVHHRFFSSVVGFDGRLLALNLFYLGWIVLIPFSSQVLGDHGGDSAAVVLYAVNLSGVVLVGMLMAADARRDGLSQMPEEEALEGQRHRAIHRRGVPRLDPGGLRRPGTCRVSLACPVLRPPGPPAAAPSS